MEYFKAVMIPLLNILCDCHSVPTLKFPGYMDFLIRGGVKTKEVQIVNNMIKIRKKPPIRIERFWPVLCGKPRIQIGSRVLKC